MKNTNVPQNLIFINACPFSDYFKWQQDVLLTNFREHGISNQAHVLIWYKEGGNLGSWYQLVQKYREVKFFFYKDEGVDEGFYIPQLRPQVLKQYFEAHQDASDKVFFYHDADILFNYLPDFEQLSLGKINWQSDTSGYLDYDYLSRKEIEGKIENSEVVKHLCEIGRVSPDLLKSYTGNTGGAQYILKGVDSQFWADVERDSLLIRGYLMNEINKKYFTSENAGFQSWCADMWAVNFNLWNRGKTTQTTKLLDFSWATDSIETYNKKPIYHNAGATHRSKNLFFKGAWIDKSPIGQNLRVSKNFASSKYVEAIGKVKK